METQLDNILVKRNHCSYELIFKKKPKVWSELHGFGEICIYSKLLKTSSKINNKGELSMMVGFSYNHPNLTFRLFKFSTKSIIHSRDVKWLNKYYSEYFNCDKITKSSLLPYFPVNELVIPLHNNNNKNEKLYLYLWIL